MTKAKAPVVLSIAAVKPGAAANAPQSIPTSPKPADQTHARPAPRPAPAPQSDTAKPADALHDLVEATATRIEHRAGLVATLAALNGVDIPVSDVAEFMWTTAPGDVTIGALAKALGHTGVDPKIHNRLAISPKSWPAIAMMTNGQSVLVLSQEDDTLTVFDATCVDNRAEVPVADFAPFFAGSALAAKVSLRQLADRHVPQLTTGHWFWGEFSKYRRHVGEIMLGSLVANLLAVAVALFSLQVYDRVIPHQSEATLWVLAMGVVAAILLEGALKLARARMSDAAGRRMELSIQHRLMKRLLGMRSDRRPLPPSGLFAAMRDFGAVRDFFTSSTIAVLADMPFILIFLALVASIAGNMVWVLIAGGLLMVLPAYVLQKRMIALSRQTQGASTKVGRLLQEVITELDTVKTQRGEDRVLRLWDELNEVSSHSSAEQRRLAATLTHWSQGVQQITYIATVVIGTYLVFAGEFTVGTIIATGILTSRTLAPLTQFAGTLARWSNVKGALEALDTIALSEQEKDSTRKYLRRETIKGQFELREVSFSYDEDAAPTLDVPGVVIKPGQRVTILGANGSGKSTLLKLLAGLYGPTKGRILVDGADMGQIDQRDLRRGIGYLSQDVRLFAGSLRDNLNLTQLERDDDRLMAALDFAGLGEFIRNHAQGLDLQVRDGGEGLSIGQRQSIGWARLWLQNPPVVLLDEPTAALDQTLERTLVSRLGTWLDGRTALIATHRTPILALSTRTLILQSGRLVVDGPREKVLAHLAAGERA
ncbi:Toxin RTX-I translocation ATP-binding protein [Shimia sp. SK013]|uniref:ATP-binding cassette domain-containing protein n=1 Tax=Shimia sp. SK013 TaxID=1389006 RepID=UPI0006CC49F6|nr:ATP-binding cassette domain-containing protein [Shimia sp. SK013]KPA22246.1 Toxin RTX-I translocation ATP-binding protein [Shimia sp. SK013]